MLSGVPIVYGIDPAAVETVPSHQLGAMGVTADGRKFRYAYAGAVALVAFLISHIPYNLLMSK